MVIMFGTWSIPNSTLPPDVILEVGPQPCCIRYTAHSSLLSLHSGYLRAALRSLDFTKANVVSSECRRSTTLEQHAHIVSTASSPTSVNVMNAGTTVLYLSNVTSEQFMPLLTYMYTGYLDLTLDNIFGVLLATHLLHMPRALELCRTFLSSSSSTLSTVVHADGRAAASDRMQMLERSYYNPKTTTVTTSASSDIPKVVRPIASKALATDGLHFVAPPTASQISLFPTSPFRALCGYASVPIANHSEQKLDDVGQQDTNEPSSHSPISVTHYDDDDDDSSLAMRALPRRFIVNDEDSTDSITVDGECDTNELKVNSQLPSNRKCTDSAQLSVKRQKPIVLDNGDVDGRTGVIIDIASCDGPVRFRRVLNVMYGCNKNNQSRASTSDNVIARSDVEEQGKIAFQHRSLRYSSSFHQQMARNISDTGKLNDESSLSSSYSGVHNLPQRQHHGQLVPQQELQRVHNQQKDENSKEHNMLHDEKASASSTGLASYTCMYCKHSFKSYYCYQKHAKRHLIPLRLDHGSEDPQLTASSRSTKIDHNNTGKTKVFSDGRRRGHSGSIRSKSVVGAVKREVKPLDMNVQYYPCKTCGSKFPSYYFVHKHRKLCHADEDNDVSEHGNTSRNCRNTDTICTNSIGDTLEQKATKTDSIGDVKIM